MTEDEIINHNMQVSFENDLHFTWDALARFKQDYVAKCKTGKHVLQVGLGFQGIGQAWQLSDGLSEEQLEALPVRQCWYSLLDPERRCR